MDFQDGTLSPGSSSRTARLEATSALTNRSQPNALVHLLPQVLHEISATHVGASLFPAIGDACAMRQIDRCRAGIGLSECNARVRRSARMRAELCAGSQATRLSEGPGRSTAPHVSDLPTSRRTVFILMRQSVPAQAAERGHHCAHTDNMQSHVVRCMWSCVLNARPMQAGLAPYPA
jgi:hypothetical protein